MTSCPNFSAQRQIDSARPPAARFSNAMDVGNPSKLSRALPNLYDKRFFRRSATTSGGCSFSDEETLRVMHDVETAPRLRGSIRTRARRRARVAKPLRNKSLAKLSWYRPGHRSSREVRRDGRSAPTGLRPRNAGAPGVFAGPRRKQSISISPIAFFSALQEFSSILKDLISCANGLRKKCNIGPSGVETPEDKRGIYSGGLGSPTARRARIRCRACPFLRQDEKARPHKTGEFFPQAC